ncbi:dynactin subunit 3-like [Ptychodera flava]|uniref:dynactin subunit 3-like n=1 Tax=Ptychodera flava TaxID=63121 RepID=UPI00396A2794
MATADSADQTLESLNARLKVVEDRLFGNRRVSTTRDNKKLLDTVANFSQSMNTATAGRDNIGALWKRLDELEECLDPSLVDKLTLDDELKAEIVLAEEKHLRTQAALLEKVQKMKDILDSEHLKVTSNMSDKMQSLAVINITQKEEADALSQETRQLLEAYNNIITLLSKQFVQWDEMITKYEVASQNKSDED